ncbi:hypothetical protein [Amaricoccus sp.]|uniref:hypothetical protein n=1 Tax=Amaricoccus sp. TaxID=1872485 RepID=UPI001B792356|nr:hypothetical protein [Amaricoccus sp.]MBP7001222.1 hypothetical protein [Amaricoccus sp.]
MRAALILALAALAGPAAAQTSAELPRALTACLANAGDLRGAMKALEAAGYAYTPEDFGGGPTDVLHWYASPDKAVTVAISFGSAHDGDHCAVIPRGVTVAQAVPYAKAAAEQVLGRRLEPGTPNIWFDDLGACVAGWTKAAGRVVQVAAASAGQDPACDAGAPAQIMIRSGRS